MGTEISWEALQKLKVKKKCSVKKNDAFAALGLAIIELNSKDKKLHICISKILFVQMQYVCIVILLSPNRI